MSVALPEVHSVHPRVSMRAVGTALAVVALVSAAVGIGNNYRLTRASAAASHAADVRALADLTMPATFERVASAWGCLRTEQSACFTSTLDSAGAARAVAAALGGGEFTTTLGHGGVPTRYGVCASVGTGRAFALVSARPANAVQQGNLWVVPEGQTPRYEGSVVDVALGEADLRCP